MQFNLQLSMASLVSLGDYITKKSKGFLMTPELFSILFPNPPLPPTPHTPHPCSCPHPLVSVSIGYALLLLSSLERWYNNGMTRKPLLRKAKCLCCSLFAAIQPWGKVVCYPGKLIKIWDFKSAAEFQL